VILGLEVRDGALVAVIVDEDGGVVAVDKRDGATPAVVADAVRAVAHHAPAAFGAAVRDPGSNEAADVVASAVGSARLSGSPRVVTRGAAVALAEQWRGAASGATHVVALTASDCVHAGMVVDGRIFEGAHGLAGAAGWLALNPVERDDYRRLGCLEAEIGAPGVIRRLVWRLKAGDSSQALDMAGGRVDAITIADVFAAARQNDGVAVSVVRDTARYIGMAVGNLVTIVDPEVVVLGGIIADGADLLVEPALIEARRRLSPHVGSSLRLVAGALGDEAAALGAARAAMLSR
jgi:glucokinase